MKNLAICCIIKDELDIPEWIAYHRLVGVQHFFLYDNESVIPIEIKSDDVTIIPWLGQCQQMKTYNHCLQQYGKEYQWIAFIDADNELPPDWMPFALDALEGMVAASGPLVYSDLVLTKRIMSFLFYCLGMASHLFFPMLQGGNFIVMATTFKPC